MTERHEHQALDVAELVEQVCDVLDVFASRITQPALCQDTTAG